MDLKLAILALLAACMLCSSAVAAEYWVSPDGDDDNPGTADKPWKSLWRVNIELNPWQSVWQPKAMIEGGDTIIFADGEYEGCLEPMTWGAENAPITLRAEHPLGAVLTGGPSRDRENLCIRLKNVRYLNIEGFFLLPKTGGWMRLDNVQHCEISHCRMENATSHGSPIRCSDSHYNRYHDLICWRSNNIGTWGHVAGDMWNNFNCSHNVFERIHISRAGHRPFGIWFDSPYNVVRDCIFDCRWGRNFEFFSAPRNLIENCVVTNGFDGSGSADGRAKLFIIDSIFRRNVIYRNAYGPIVANAYKYQDLPTFGIERSRLYNNTFAYNLDYAIQLADIGGDHRHMIHGNVVKNNIFAFNDPGGDGMSLMLAGNISNDNKFHSNLLYGAKPGDKTVRYYQQWASPTAWEDGAFSVDEAEAIRPKQFKRNVDADPLFVDGDADDFRLQSASPAINAGKELTRVKAASTGTVVPVEDARWFFDGFEIPGEVGDVIFIGSERQQARVVKADIDEDTLTVDHDVTVDRGDKIWLAYKGDAPDLGAYEYGAENEAWYSAPQIPDALRLPTMETATEPLVVTDFEPENLEEWHYCWNFSRQQNTDARMDDTTAASGTNSMRIFATADNAIMSCDIRPRWWNIDRYPFAKFSYRIPEGVPVGLWLYPFPNMEHGIGAVCVGGTSTRTTGAYKSIDYYQLVDDGEWHEILLDVRVIRSVFPDVDLMKMFRFWTAEGNGMLGHEYWFDNFQILPAE